MKFALSNIVNLYPVSVLYTVVPGLMVTLPLVVQTCIMGMKVFAGVNMAKHQGKLVP